MEDGVPVYFFILKLKIARVRSVEQKNRTRAFSVSFSCVKAFRAWKRFTYVDHRAAGGILFHEGASLHHEQVQ